MSSGSLPLTSYYRASSIGEGAFGAVVVVYDDDGNEYALKQFVDEDSDDEEEEECEDSDDDSDYEDEDEDEEDEEEEDNDDEDEDEEEDNRTVVNLGALREISILRILRGDNGHENIVPMIDVVQNSSYFESEEECGSLPYLSMTIPLYKSGSLADAIEQGSLANNRIGKISIAFGLLNAVDYLHSNGIIHRDIKSDNILLEPMDTTSTSSTSSTAAAPKNNKKQNNKKKKNQKNKNKNNNNSNQEVVWKPILIDFSLAKVVNCSMYRGEYATKYPSDMMKELKQEDNNNDDDDDILCRNFQNLILNDNNNPEELQRIQKLFPLPSSQKNKNNSPKKTPHKKGNKNNNKNNKNKKDKKSSSHDNIQLHTDEVGTVTYIAPEVVDRKGYDLPCDLWSVGVVLLEMISPPNTFSQIQKNKHAFQFVEEKKQSLPNQPLPNLIRQLLITDPHQRWTAQQALQNSDVFAKFGFVNKTNTSTKRIIQMHKAFADPDKEEDEDDEGNDTKNDNDITESEREKENNNHAIHDNNNNTNFKTPQKNSTTTKSAKSTGGGRRQRKGKASCYDNRYKIVQTICNTELHCQHPMTAISALEYAQELEQLEPRETLYDVKQSQHLLDCIVLAHRFWEKDVLDLDDLCDQDENEEYPTFHAAQWDLQHYIDSEDTLWMLMDYCLYPRNIIILNKE